MSDRNEASASAPEATYWKHDVITLSNQAEFLVAVDDAVNIKRFEVASYSCTAVGGQLIYSALLRRRPTGEEHAMIHQDRIDVFEASLEERD